MRKHEAVTRIRAAFEGAGYTLVSGATPAVHVRRILPGVVEVDVIAVAPWLGPDRCDVIYRAAAPSMAKLAARAERNAANREAPPPAAPSPVPDRVVISYDEAEEIEEALAAAAAALAKDGSDESVALIRRLAKAAVPVSGDVHSGCDACDIDEYSVIVVEAADDLIPPRQTAYDANGDPDVTICGFCILDDERNPRDFHDEVSPEEMERILRDEQALVEGDPDV